jgi:HlyD family secretion protein
MVEGVVTYETTLLVDNTEGLLRPGMTASATITVDEVSGALLVPNEAFRYDPDATGGFVATGPGEIRLQGAQAREADEEGRREIWLLRDGEPESVYVTPGSSDGRMTAVTTDELSEGDEVILYREETP